MYPRLILFVLLIWSTSVFTAELNNATQDEIAHLFTFISNSPCQFFCNGTWYDSADAADHINTKYQYVLARGLIHTSEDFIHYAASKSSLSGKSYRVKCGDSAEITSSEWLTKELASYRNAIK